MLAEIANADLIIEITATNSTKSTMTKTMLDFSLTANEQLFTL